MGGEIIYCLIYGALTAFCVSSLLGPKKLKRRMSEKMNKRQRVFMGIIEVFAGCIVIISAVLLFISVYLGIFSKLIIGSALFILGFLFLSGGRFKIGLILVLFGTSHCIAMFINENMVGMLAVFAFAFVIGLTMTIMAIKKILVIRKCREKVKGTFTGTKYAYSSGRSHTDYYYPIFQYEYNGVQYKGVNIDNLSGFHISHF